jgi:hypothetical protein
MVWLGSGKDRPSTVAVFLGLFAHKKKSKDTQCLPPTAEPVSQNFLDETFFWILADEKERQALRAHNSLETRAGRSSNTSFAVGDLPSASIAR